ncbi:hypothetical protein SS50377_27070 [Spironucleus salmonicida]|uniref:Uncharacterized protein n=1 Tax=Spironucleus salmonicida TaxID=348837 RepID=V6LUX7_9EUKA|nr:hypothetical protein SS50377_27070 [Spironucleus salmonicida]|eukprot:EST48053.1 Hypothetical protein SS50377_11819 [Spironucleus salmonicida]
MKKRASLSSAWLQEIQDGVQEESKTCDMDKLVSMICSQEPQKQEPTPAQDQEIKLQKEFDALIQQFEHMITVHNNQQ